ncbi:MAG TPA: hypothetical protein VKJ65_04500 [Phycisphaerae bacterium]|nr:hypothetical protein [Phycisphaerae bacterium]
MNLNLKYVSFRGPPISDSEILTRLPQDLQQLLAEVNGFIMFDGGLHIRGACFEPEWHSLRKVWEAELALFSLYPAIRSDDVPFAQDCLGDQFVLRNGVVHRLAGETGQLSSLGVGLFAFLDEAQKGPVKYLGLHPLVQFQRENGHFIRPGELLDANPLFCMQESGAGVHFEAVPALKRLSFLAHVAGQISRLPDGTKIKFKIVNK